MDGRATIRRIRSSNRYLVILADGVIETGAILVATARSGTVSSAGAKALAFGFVEPWLQQAKK
jgi:hypothetical protein